MRTVAKWFVGAGFAAAPGNFFFFGDFDKHGPHAGGAVGTITKRLGFGFTAAAPNVTAWFDSHDKRMVVMAHRFELVVSAAIV
jgi:hypothetical protein